MSMTIVDPTAFVEGGNDEGFPDFDVTLNNSDDRTCSVCGVPLEYNGKGRPPTKCDEHKRTSGKKATRANASSSGSTRDVKAALAALESLDGMLVVGMMLVSGPAAATFNAQREALQERNATILEANPSLAKTIANAAAKTGPLALVVSYGMALGPAFLVARADAEQRAAQAQHEQAS